MLPGISGLSWAKVGMAVAVLAVVGWLFWSRAEWRADAKEAQGAVAVLQVANTAQNATIAELRDALRLRDEAAAEHKTTMDEIKKRGSAREIALQRAERDDAEVAAWLAGRLPARIADGLRR